MEKDINNINFKGLIKYLRKHYGENGIRLLTGGLVDNDNYLIQDKFDPSKTTPVKIHHLEDEAYWVSNEFSLMLLANVKKVVPGPEPLFEAGVNSVIEVLARDYLIAAKVLDLKFLIKKATQINSRFNRTKDVIPVEITDNSVSFELRYKPGYRVTKDVCNWNLGIYYGLARVNGAQNIKIKEITCAAEGAACCTFKLTWERVKITSRIFKWLMRTFTRELINSYENTIQERDDLIDRLRRSEARYRALTDNSLTGIYILQDHAFVYANSRFVSILGYSPEEIIGKKIWEICHPDFRHELEERARAGPLKSHFELCALRKGGEQIWLEVLSNNIQGHDQAVIMGNVIDITERKRTEKALRLSEERFAKAFNASPNPMAISTCEDGRYLEVNESFKIVTGYQLEEVRGFNPLEVNILPGPEIFERALQILREQGSLRNFESFINTKGGEKRFGLFSAEILNIGSEKYILTVFNDLTERRQLEKEVAHLDRLNLVGEMAAGIGHEIRNPMTTVRGFLQLLGDKKECGQFKEYFNLMIEELDRTNSIITEFLSMAKNKTVDLKIMDLNGIIRAMIPLIQSDAIKNDMDTCYELNDVPGLLLDEKEIRQLILNLARNGLEAMSPGGVLTFRTYTDGGEVVLAVCDRGPGIDPELLEKIGTPFFTTKDEGTGLGLAVCYSIAARHKAVIEIETSPAGTTFLVRFREHAD